MPRDFHGVRRERRVESGEGVRESSRTWTAWTDGSPRGRGGASTLMSSWPFIICRMHGPKSRSGIKNPRKGEKLGHMQLTSKDCSEVGGLSRPDPGQCIQRAPTERIEASAFPEASRLAPQASSFAEEFVKDVLGECERHPSSNPSD